MSQVEMPPIEWSDIDLLTPAKPLADSCPTLIISVDTRDFCFIMQEREPTWELPRKYRGVVDIKTEFLTYEEVVARLLNWRERNFSPNYAPDPRQRPDNYVSLNPAFRYIRIYRMPKGYIWCTNDLVSIPTFYLEKAVHFPKVEELAPVAEITPGMRATRTTPELIGLRLGSKALASRLAAAGGLVKLTHELPYDTTQALVDQQGEAACAADGQDKSDGEILAAHGAPEVHGNLISPEEAKKKPYVTVDMNHPVKARISSEHSSKRGADAAVRNHYPQDTVMTRIAFNKLK